MRAEAITRGISEATLDKALTGLEPLPVVIERDRTQAEIVQTLDQYLAQRVSAQGGADGADDARRRTRTLLERRQREVRRAARHPHRGVGARVELRPVQRRAADDRDAGDARLRSAALGDVPRRSCSTRSKILDSGDVEPAAMRGSWAGALGQPQFMPSSFLLYAQDFDGDGRRDIWNSTPDVFASIANYLAGARLERAISRGAARSRAAPRCSTALPETRAAADRGLPRATADDRAAAARDVEEARRHARTAAARCRRPTSSASLVSGVKRHFLVYPNYQAILEYNCVNAYGLSVGLLGDARRSRRVGRRSRVGKKPARRRDE